MAETRTRETHDTTPDIDVRRNGSQRPHGTPSGTPPPVTNTVNHLPSNGDREARRRRIEESAYYRAERRGFAPGGEVSDWLEAEKEIPEDPKESASR